MNLWMAVMRDLELVMDDHERLFDAWAEGGVDGVAIGPLAFSVGTLEKGGLPEDDQIDGVAVAPDNEEGPPVAVFDPNPLVYERLGVEPPAPPEQTLPEHRALLDRTLNAAKNRGLSVYIIYADSGAGPGGDGHHFEDQKSMQARLARMVDTLEHFPMADGVVMDGPEWGYEIDPHHMNRRSLIFDDLPASVAPLCARLGYDYEALAAARDRLFELLHNLDPRRARLYGGGGLLGGFHLLGADPDLMAWLKFKVDALTAFFRFMREGLAAELDRPLQVGVGPRSPAFAPLCGYDPACLAEFMDFLLPKHYFWHRGFDGFVGTIHRYVETLREWNSSVTAGDALEVVQALFGIVLPGVREEIDFETVLSAEFFQDIVASETARGVAAVGDPQRLVPWLETGRHPHDGDPMSAGDLRQLLEASRDAGLQRFLFHHQGHLTAGEWTVISEICGTRWNPRKSSYHPADMPVM